MIEADGTPARCVLTGDHEWHEDAEGYRWLDLDDDDMAEILGQAMRRN